MCSELIEVEPDRLQIVCSRSFGREVTDVEDVCQAVAAYAIRAWEKPRERSLQASGVWVCVNTNPFREGARQYHPSKALNLIAPSFDTREVLRVAQALTRAMFKKEYRYKKAGVGLLDLTHGDREQPDLCAQIDPRSAKLMAVLDATNRKFGKGSLGFASSAWRAQQRPVWAMRQEHLSPSYTTNWKQLIKVR